MIREDSQAGRFITFEGIDGCGKTTVIRFVEQHLRQRQIPVLVTREPGGTTVGNEIRQVLLKVSDRAVTPKTELLLYAADRAQHVYERILPALREGRVVLCDRYTDATRAYQGYGRGFDLAWIESLMEFATGGLKPDLTILLDVDVAVARQRLQGRRERVGSASHDRLDAEDIQFHERVRQAYLELARQEPDRIKVVSAAGTPQQSCQAALEWVLRLLGLQQ
ncbi:MAG: dTMP kinase [Acidobacteriota bacterium]|nr:dTMP kinase [Blastocatellia bacterium]MDW8239050.1 dTMP kinase [Acidobacteriota bacterium]